MTAQTKFPILDNIDYERVFKGLKLFTVDVIRELYLGFKTNSFPFVQYCFSTMIVLMGVLLGLDYLFFKAVGLEFLYPTSFWLWIGYKVWLICMSAYIWGLYQGILRLRLIKKLTQILTEAGLKSALGRLPSFISDEPLDEDSRKLRLRLRGQSFKDFKEAKDRLESSLQVHIDEISENRRSGTVDILYSHNELTDKFHFRHLSELKEDEFIIGLSRAKTIKENLSNVPHLLVAGQTGGGKSTFIRQLITSLYLKNKKYSFELIDLKGGLEFQIFEQLPRVKVVSNIQSAIKVLQNQADKTLKERMELFKLNSCKDIESFFKIPEDKRKYPKGKKGRINLGRKVIVVDEAAEVFRVNSYATAQDIAKARNSAAKIAAQGRALGVHLVVATQKPNVSSVDGNIKTNLTGRICFRMADIASSNTILDNKRAADLSNIKGRAVWRSDSELKEIQAPLMLEDTASKLLEKFYNKTSKYTSNKDMKDLDKVKDE